MKAWRELINIEVRKNLVHADFAGFIRRKHFAPFQISEFSFLEIPLDILSKHPISVPSFKSRLNGNTEETVIAAACGLPELYKIYASASGGNYEPINDSVGFSRRLCPGEKVLYFSVLQV